MQAAEAALSETKTWDKPDIDKALVGTVKQNDFHTAKFFMDLRIAITGSKVTPPINDSIAIMEREDVVSRLRSILK